MFIETLNRAHDVIELLAERDLLPALWFIFSRAGCEDAVRRARQDGVRLAPPEDRPTVAGNTGKQPSVPADERPDALHTQGVGIERSGGMDL